MRVRAADRMSTTSDTVLLIMDMHAPVVDRYPGSDVVERAAEAAAAARAAGIPVVFVRVAFRAGHPEITTTNRTFAPLRELGAMTEDETPLHPALERRTDEPIVTKRRISAFTGSDLEVLLRGLGAR